MNERREPPASTSSAARCRGWSRAVARAALAATLGFAAVCHADPAPQMQAEVDFLLSAVAGSGCDFFRNGTWYDAKAAAAHLRSKYEALLKRDLIRDSDDFIDRAASQSSLSGRPYAIRCGSDASIPTRQWFSRELAYYRAQHAQNE